MFVTVIVQVTGSPTFTGPAGSTSFTKLTSVAHGTGVDVTTFDNSEIQFGAIGSLHLATTEMALLGS